MRFSCSTRGSGSDVPFDIKVEADATLKQFDALTKNIADLQTETTTTFLAWQSEDMHRKFPKVEGSGLSVATTIYPRSQLRRTKNLTGGKSVRRRSVIAAGRPAPGSKRPILRPELFDQLKERMIDMVKEAFTWQ
jgi:hypothetical protein